jgi:outer membrane protein assembly factor BamB
VDKTALAAAIDAANAAKNGVAVDTAAVNVLVGTFWVTPAEMDALNAALAAGQAVRNDASAAAAQVDEAKTTLTTATATFNSQKKAGTSTGTGSTVWARTVTAGNNNSYFSAVTADSSGNVYAAGGQSGTGNYNYGSGTITGTYSHENAVLVKYDSSGTAQWAKTVTAGSNNSWFNAVAVDSSGNVYAAGYQYDTGTYIYGSGVSVAGTYSEENAVLVKYDSSGTALWARTVTAGSNISEFNAVAVDSSGNIYAAGHQNGTGNYNYGSGTITGTYSHENAVLVKYDSSGTAQWAKTVTTGSSASRFNATVVDSSGNIYAAGYQYGTGNYNYGSGNIAGTGSVGDNAVLVKYDSSGTAQWAKTVTAGNSSMFNAAAVDSSGNIYAAGYQQGTSNYNYGSGNIAGTYNSFNAVLVKYDSSGTAQWAKTVTTGSSASRFNATVVDSSGAVYAAGYQNTTSNFNYGSGNIAGTAYADNAVLVKYDSSGTAQWAKTVTVGSNHSRFYAAAADSSGTVYTAGYQTGTGNFNYGSGNIAGTASGINHNAVLVKYAQ